jgi:hypothetical protein
MIRMNVMLKAITQSAIIRGTVTRKSSATIGSFTGSREVETTMMATRKMTITETELTTIRATPSPVNRTVSADDRRRSEVRERGEGARRKSSCNEQSARGDS